METLVNITKVLGLIVLCVLFILILASVIYAPFRKKKNDEKINKLADEIMNQLVTALKEDNKEETKEPKKRGRKPRKTTNKEDK